MPHKIKSRNTTNYKKDSKPKMTQETFQRNDCSKTIHFATQRPSKNPHLRQKNTLCCKPTLKKKRNYCYVFPKTLENPKNQTTSAFRRRQKPTFARGAGLAGRLALRRANGVGFRNEALLRVLKVSRTRQLLLVNTPTAVTI